MGLISRYPQKAHLGRLLIVHTKFRFFAQFGGELCEEQTQKIRKNDQKPTYLKLLRDENRLKSLDPKNAHLGHSPNVHT